MKLLETFKVALLITLLFQCLSPVAFAREEFATEECRLMNPFRLAFRIFNVPIDTAFACEPQCGDATIGKVISWKLCVTPAIARVTERAFFRCVRRCSNLRGEDFSNPTAYFAVCNCPKPKVWLPGHRLGYCPVPRCPLR